MNQADIIKQQINALEVRQLRIENDYKAYEDGHSMTPRQVVIMSKALGIDKGCGYRPYHIACDTMPRMALVKEGFLCPHCFKRIGFDLKALSQ